MTCACGAGIDVPTLLELKRLERVKVDEPARPARRWGVRQRVMSVGGLIAVAGLLTALGLLFTLPPGEITDQDRVALRERVERMTLAETLNEWAALYRLPPEQPPPYQQVRFARRQERIAYVWLAAGVSLLGMAVFASGFLVSNVSDGRKSRTGRPRSPSRGRQAPR